MLTQRGGLKIRRFPWRRRATRLCAAAGLVYSLACRLDCVTSSMGSNSERLQEGSHVIDQHFTHTDAAEAEVGGFSVKYWQALAVVRKRRRMSRNRAFKIHAPGAPCDGAQVAQSGLAGEGERASEIGIGGEGAACTKERRGARQKRPPTFNKCPWLTVDEPKTGEIFDINSSILRYSSGSAPRKRSPTLISPFLIVSINYNMIFTNFPKWSKVPVERARAREKKGAREKERESERERERERERAALERKSARVRAHARERDALSWRAVLHAGVHAPMMHLSSSPPLPRPRQEAGRRPLA